MKPSTILKEAEKIVYGRGEAEYGHPSDNFQDEADAFSGFLHARGLLPRDKQLSATDIAWFNVLQKVIREAHKPKRDNRVDVVGYALTAERVESES